MTKEELEHLTKRKIEDEIYIIEETFIFPRNISPTIETTRRTSIIHFPCLKNKKNGCPELDYTVIYTDMCDCGKVLGKEARNLQKIVDLQNKMRKL